MNFIQPEDSGGVLVELVEQAAGLDYALHFRRPSPRRFAMVAERGRLPVPSRSSDAPRRSSGPHHHMRCAGADLVMAAGAAMKPGDPGHGDRKRLDMSWQSQTQDPPAAASTNGEMPGQPGASRSADGEPSEQPSSSTLSIPRILS